MTMQIEEEIFISAQPKSLFDAWTEPQHLTVWWGSDEEFRTVEFVRELAVGGKWRAKFRHVSGALFSASGEYRRVDPPNHLSFTWKPEWNDEPASLIELEFRKVSGGTLLRLRQTGLPSQEAVAENKAAWTPTMDWLKCYLER